MVIYTVSHQHAAVNYFQEKYLAFIPAGEERRGSHAVAAGV